MATHQKTYQPPIVFHPGETLAEKLSELQMGAKEFALRTGKPEKTIHAVLGGASSITPEMAVRFEHVLQIPAQFWLSLQRLYDEFVARENNLKTLMQASTWAKKFPVKEMVKHGWIEQRSTSHETVVSLLNFFRISNHSAWEDYYFDQQLKVAFRISLRSVKDPFAISAWLRQGEIQAERLNTAQYDAAMFKEGLAEARALMVRQPPNLWVNLQEICCRAGVNLVHTPCIKNAPITGSTRWYRDNPLIQLSGRYRRNDVFWFTFFHEAGHVLLHGKKEIFLEDAEDVYQDPQKEQDANEFAVRWTLTSECERELQHRSKFTADDVRTLARKFNTHPAIIVGRLRHDKKVRASFGADFFATFDLV